MTGVDDHSDPFAGNDGKLEPHCTTCRDRGVLLDEAAEGDMGSGQNCPYCNPTPEQAAAAAAEHNRLVAAGAIDTNADPF